MSNGKRAYAQGVRVGNQSNQNQSAYRQLFRAAVSNVDLTAIRESTHKGWALGSDRFKAQIERLTQRRTTSKGGGAAADGGAGCLS